MTAERNVRFTQDGALGTITLDSPPLNLIGAELISDLVSAIGHVEEARGLHALVLRGEGNAFSAGADVAIFAGMGATQLRPLIGSCHRPGPPYRTVAVPDSCGGSWDRMAGGFEPALFCDLVWAAEGTMLGLPETRLGIVPLAGGDLHAAEEFAAWGVIDRVVPADELHSAAEQFAHRLAAGPTRAFSVVKELARAFSTGGIAGADALLTDAAVDLFDTEDAEGGIESFLKSGLGHAVFAGR